MPRPASSEESSDSTSDSHHSNINLDESIRKFEQTLVDRGINPTEHTNNTLAWDHEGLDQTPRKPHVSEGESDEEYLEYLKALDPCQGNDDNAFAERVNSFLKLYNQKNLETKEKSKERPVLQTEVSSYSVEPTEGDSNVYESFSESHLTSTPGPFLAPGAQSTPFTPFQEKCIPTLDKLIKERKRNIVPRRLQSGWRATGKTGNRQGILMVREKSGKKQGILSEIREFLRDCD